MKITVNGQELEVRSPGLTSLLSVLREELDVVGPKAGCESGGCGACSVMVDGTARRSCLTPVAAIEGAEVTTVEGLGDSQNLSAVQQAFVHHYAAQCGFCTPGMVIAATHYLDKGGSDDQEAIHEALGGHVCRCTGYVKISEAVAAAARGESFDLATTAEGGYTTIATGDPS